jgi:hypothetical protein
MTAEHIPTIKRQMTCRLSFASSIRAHSGLYQSSPFITPTCVLCPEAECLHRQPRCAMNCAIAASLMVMRKASTKE